ncbi:MAG: acyl carrier protein [Vicinamibacterales bacterium]
MTQPVVAATVTDSEIQAMLASIVAESLRIDPARVTPDTSLVALGAESIDIVEITMEIEHTFSVLMPEHTILQLAADVAGPDEPFEEDGALTSLGVALLQARMPDVAATEISAGMRVRDLSSTLTRVGAWIRLIRGLLEVSPRQCPDCRTPLVQGSPARVRCTVCGREVDLPSGDDIGRAWVREWLAARAG